MLWWSFVAFLCYKILLLDDANFVLLNLSKTMLRNNFFFNSISNHFYRVQLMKLIFFAAIFCPEPFLISWSSQLWLRLINSNKRMKEIQSGCRIRRCWLIFRNNLHRVVSNCLSISIGSYMLNIKTGGLCFWLKKEELAKSCIKWHSDVGLNSTFLTPLRSIMWPKPYIAEDRLVRQLGPYVRRYGCTCTMFCYILFNHIFRKNLKKYKVYLKMKNRIIYFSCMKRTCY